MVFTRQITLDGLSPTVAGSFHTARRNSTRVGQYELAVGRIHYVNLSASVMFWPLLRGQLATLTGGFEY